MSADITSAVELRIFELSMFCNRISRALAIQGRAKGIDNTWQAALTRSVLEEKGLILEVLEAHRKRLTELAAPESVIEENADDIACVQAAISSIEAATYAADFDELRAMVLVPPVTGLDG